MLIVTNRIPATTVTIRLHSLNPYKHEFDSMADGLRDYAKACYCCGHSFLQADAVFVGDVEGVGLRLFCSTCANRAEDQS
ncbi:MAG TPA: hypothetical protein VMX74_08400 [Pirellulales bacterium]|nr:hypothetical protein [Pirellulales bacterium]